MSNTHTTHFSIRLPKELNRRIQERCMFTRRSRNAEILYMLERQLDAAEEANEEALKASEPYQKPD